MRVLITGGSGLLGRALCQVFAERHQVIAPAHSEMPVEDYSITRTMMEATSPEAVIHAAAIPNPDTCHNNPDMALRVNALGTRNVALACAAGDIPLVYISTDYVFDGRKGEPYIEYDDTGPINVYGRSKLAGEWYVMALHRRHYIVRTGVLFAPWGSNVLLSMLERARRGEPVNAVTDQTGAPTYVVDLARGIETLLAESIYGLYHLVNHGAVTRYEWAELSLKLAGLDLGLLRPTRLAEQKRPALRPAYTALRNYVLELEGRDPMRPLEEALAECISLIASQ
jgi:dTDP-4-dehydrorhamnose reductase